MVDLGGLFLFLNPSVRVLTIVLRCIHPRLVADHSRRTKASFRTPMRRRLGASTRWGTESSKACLNPRNRMATIRSPRHYWATHRRYPTGATNEKRSEHSASHRVSNSRKVLLLLRGWEACHRPLKIFRFSSRWLIWPRWWHPWVRSTKPPY